MRIEKTGILLLSITALVTAGFVSNQAFGQGNGIGEEVEAAFDLECIAAGGIPITDPGDPRFMDCIFPSVGGEFLGVDSTALLVTGAQMNASWMIPVIVSAIGIGIVIARKF